MAEKKNPKLVQIKTEDGLILPGLLYEAPRSKKVAIYLHGNGSSSVFYSSDKQDEQIKTLNKAGISILFFNNRGAHYVKRLNVIKKGGKKKKRFGAAYEKIKDCIKDIDGAQIYLEKLGYQEFYLIGTSTGANKICVYHYYKPKNKFSKYILLSSGDDVGIYYDILGRKKFFELLKRSKEKIKKRKGEEIITELLPDSIFSYIGFYDTVNPDGDYNIFPFLEVTKNLKLSKKPVFRHFKSINKPCLVIYGEKDGYAWGDIPKIVSILKEQKPELEYKVIKGSDHSFTKGYKELSWIMSRWLAS